jgi:hypothetical protein
MSERHEKQVRSQTRSENKESGARKATRERRLRPVFILLSVIVVAAAAWVVLDSSDENPPPPAATQELLASSAPASNYINAGNPPTGGPRIVFPETSYDFGTITQGSNVSHTFVVRNAGDAPLTLIDVGGS